MTSRVMSRSSAAKRTAKIGGKRITAKQRVARVKNIAVARMHKKRGKGKMVGSNPRLVNRVTTAAKYRGYDKRTTVKAKWQKKQYKDAYKKSYARTKGQVKSLRTEKAHKSGLRASTRTRTWNPYGTGGYYDSWRLPGKKYRPRKRSR